MASNQPLELSVIIASHNRRELLRRCLEALCSQTVDFAPIEVVVADDGSTDGTAPMVESFPAPFTLRVLHLPKGGKSAALNAAIDAARGRVCLFLDDDIVAAPELLEEHLRTHRQTSQALGMGVLVQEPPTDGDPYSRAFAKIWNQRYRERLGREAEWTDCYGANFSVPRATLIDVGGFAEDAPAIEDLELAFRLCRAGCSARFLPRATAVHDDQKPGGRILADEERFGAWCTEFVKAHPETRHRLLGWFNQMTIHEIALRRLLLGLRVPTPVLAWLGRLIPGSEWRQTWFGFVSRQAFWRGVRRRIGRSGWIQATRGVPVLLYHAFSETDDSERFIVPKRSFARQMRLLSLLRYRVTRLEDLALMLDENRELPRRSVAISIDDGYRDNLEIADEILRRHGFPATVFLVSARLGAGNSWDRDGELAGRPLMSLAEVKHMRDGGIGVGAHTRTHVSLPDTPAGAIETETKGSRDDLERALGMDISLLAYPYGRYDARTVGIVANGFRGACTTHARKVGFGDDPLLIPRIEIEGQDSILRFVRKLWLGSG